MTGLGFLAAVTIAFPRAGMSLPNVSQCYVIGTAPRGSGTVVVGTNAVPVYRTGGWCAMAPLRPGTNTVTAVCGDESASVTVKVAAPVPPSANAVPAAERKYEKLPYAGDAPRPHPSGRGPSQVMVALDPGHGGAKDLGAISPHGGCEKDINLLLALETRTELEKLGYRVVMTRESDVALELYGRQKAVYANNADLFVSIHHNAPPFDKNPMDLRYTAVYAWNPLGEALAGAINRRMAKALEGDVCNNGVMHANFAVTRNPEIPSCLVEVDFLTSPAGEEAVWDVSRRRRIAASIAAGIADWHAPAGAAALAVPACQTASGVDWRIVAAEQESRSIVMVSGEPGAEAKVLWRWDPAEDPSLTPEMAKSFGSIDECKPVDGGRTILVNASCGGVAAVDVGACRARWCACLPNRGEGPHSLDLLPDGRIAVAHSTGVDAVQLIDLNGHPFEPELQKVVVALPLRGAHGIVWDAARKSLFALGYTNLLELAYRPERMAVEVLNSWDYADSCGDAFGHDLVPDGRGGYFFSNRTGVWDFSPETGKFAPVLPMANVKSFSRDAEKGNLLAIPRERWWTDRLIVRERDASLRTIGPFIGARFYKARWMTVNSVAAEPEARGK